MTNQLFRSTPEAQGVSSAAISAFLDAAAQQNIELHSLMLLQHGHVIAEGWWSPYSADRIHLLYSLSKSFTSTKRKRSVMMKVPPPSTPLSTTRKQSHQDNFFDLDT